MSEFQHGDAYKYFVQYIILSFTFHKQTNFNLFSQFKVADVL